MKLNTNILTIILAVLLLVAAVYIATNWYQEGQLAKQQEAYQQGYNTGVTAAVVTLFQQTNNCNPTTINVQDNVRQIIDTACLTPAG